jgi:hypothetical protein
MIIWVLLIIFLLFVLFAWVWDDDDNYPRYP